MAQSVKPSHGMASSRMANVADSDALKRVAEKMQQDSEPVSKPTEYVESNLAKIRSMIFAGAITETVAVGGYEFVIQTLTTAQSRDVLAKLAQLGESNILFYISYHLAYAIKSLNGFKVEELYSGELTDVFMQRVEVIDNLPTALTKKLFDVYKALSDENEKLYNPSEVKEAVKK
jgi:hypothetical protein